MGDGRTHTGAWVEIALPFEERLEEVLAAWSRWALASGHSDRTIKSRTYTIRRLAVVGIDPLDATCEELTDWLASLFDRRTGRPVTRSTKVTYHAQLRAFYAWLVVTGRRQDNPTTRLPRPRLGAAVPRPLSRAQVSSVLAACADPRARQTRAYIILACYAGLRVHEIAKIRGEDIVGPRLEVCGKGGKLSTLPLHPLIAELAESMPARGWWFPTGGEAGHVHRCSVSSAIKRAMVRAGVPGTPHSCRHFYGTEVLRSSGGNLRTAQRLMRHSSPTTTARYTLIEDDELISAIAGMPVPDAA